MSRPRSAAVALAALLAALVAGCGSSSNKGPASALATPTPTATQTPTPTHNATPTPSATSTLIPTQSPTPSMAAADRSPLAGQTFYVNPNGHAVAVHDLLLAVQNDEAAAQIEKISSQPVATWFTGGLPPTAAATDLTTSAAQAHQTAVLVVYDVPQRDCGQYSAGGALTSAAYLSYVRQVAAGLHGPSVVILEPDAIAFTVSGCAAIAPAPRYELLGQAVDILRRSRPDVNVYIDAGNATWVSDFSKLADALRASGVQRAAGFALNVSNYDRTGDTVAYGTQLSDLLGGSHFVIDTSRNGNGPLSDGSPTNWCNPAGRKLGTPPTSDTGLPRVDAFLWVKQPGDSDGVCKPGQPAAGEWWENEALELAG